MSKLKESPVWRALEEHHQKIAPCQMRDLFAEDPARFDKFSLHLDDILFDFSKNRITEETVTLLTELAAQAKLDEAIKGMFRGERINNTEGRAVLHVALRNRSNRPILVGGKDVMPEVNDVLGKMKRFSEAVRSGDLEGLLRKNHHRCRQHRHWGLRPRPADGHRGAHSLYAS